MAGTIWTTWGRGLWYSTDGGSTWNDAGQPAGATDDIEGLWGPTNTWKAYTLVEDLGVYKYDGSWSLEDSYPNTEPKKTNWAYGLSTWCTDDDSIVCATGMGSDHNIIRTRVSDVWSTEFTGTVGPTVWEEVSNVHGTPDGSAIFAILQRTGFGGTQGSLLQRSGGGTWTPVATQGSTSSGYIEFNKVRVISAIDVRIFGRDVLNNKIWKWNGFVLTEEFSINYADAPFDQQFSDIWMQDNTDGWILETNLTSNRLFRWNGAAWAFHSDINPFGSFYQWAITADNLGNAWAVGAYASGSRWNGATWTDFQIEAGFPAHHYLDAFWGDVEPPTATLWAQSSQGQLWYSADEGTNWTQVNLSSLPDDNISEPGGPTSTWKIYVGVEGAGVYYYDGSWHLEDNFPENTNEHFVPPDDPKLWCSDDDSLVALTITATSSGASLIRTRPGLPGTSWVTEWTGGTLANFNKPWQIHGNGDGGEVFAIGAEEFGVLGGQDAWLMRRNPSTGVWTEVTRIVEDGAAVGSVEWYDLWVVSGTEVWIGGVIIDSGSTEYRIWKWNGTVLTSEYSKFVDIGLAIPPALSGVWGLWFARDGSEGWACIFNTYVANGAFYLYYDGATWSQSHFFFTGQVCYGVTQRDGIPSSAIVIHDGARKGHYNLYDGATWNILDDVWGFPANWQAVWKTGNEVATSIQYIEVAPPAGPLAGSGVLQHQFELVPTAGSGVLQHQFELVPVAASGVLQHQFEIVPGTLSYTTAVASARTDSGGSAAPAALGSLAVEEEIEGWKWDQRTWLADTTENWAMFIPANWDPTVSGVTRTYFQSGIGSNRDLELVDIETVPSSGLHARQIYNVWAPELLHGYYYDFNEQGYLFSDDSEIVYPTRSGVVTGIGSYTTANGFNEIELRSEPQPSIPILAQQFKWDQQDGKYELELEVKKKVQFTGIRDSNNIRQSTYNAATESILWDKTDRTKQEFIITHSGVNPKAIFNNQYVQEVGEGTVPSDLEELGFADGSANQQFRLAYAPVDSSIPAKIYSYIAGSGTVTEWTPISFSETPVGDQVKFDYDWGILEFGDSSIVGQNIPAAGSTVGANYWKTLKLEYEPKESVDTVIATEASVNPIYRQSGRGFVYLGTALEDPSSITLRANLPEIQTNVYGPLYVGNTFASVIATVKDRRGQLLEDQVVTFFITSDPVAGSFGGTFNNTATGITGPEGEAKTFYNPPRTISDLGEVVTASGYSVDNSPSYTGVTQTTTLQTQDILVAGGFNDIYLYEVRVDDAIQGLLDVTLDNTEAVQLTEYYKDYFTEHEIFGPTGLTAGSGITAASEEWESNHRFWNDFRRPTIFNAGGDGKKILVATVDTEALNPHTFTAGAVAPVQPIDVIGLGEGKHDVVFDTSTFSIPEPTGTATPPTGTLYGYFIVSPTTVSMQASVFNERLNQHILSNEIEIKLDIPSYLSGLWTVDVINQVHIDEISSVLENITASGQRVPLGWRLRSTNVTLAGALDGITFLDVNPEYNAPIFEEGEFVASGVHESDVHISHRMRVV